jgi:hypothetical protein
MSHGLGTHLNAIIGYSQMIRDEVIDEMNNPIYILIIQMTFMLLSSIC